MSDQSVAAMDALDEAVALSDGRAAWLAGQGGGLRAEPVPPAVSIGLHVALVAALLLFHPGEVRKAPDPVPIDVTLISATQFRQITQPELAAPQPVPPPVVPDTVPAPPDAEPLPSSAVPTDRLPGGPVKATQFYSGSVLKEPGSRGIAKTFGTLASSEQEMQICNIEAIEQLKRWKPDFAADTVVSYAYDDVAIAKGVLRADGGAVRGHRKWWHIAFTCKPAPDFRSVVAFEFTLGDPIPKDEWEEHYLNSDDDSLD